MVEFAWGANDLFWISAFKKVFILLPCLAIIMACWMSVACLISVIVRQERSQFMTHFFVTWWELGRSILSFWGGSLRFVYICFGALFEMVKMVIAAVVIFIQDVLLVPFRVVRNIGENVLNPGVPWIAVMLTLFWSLIEAVIMTYVMRQTVIDTLSNITGETLGTTTVQIPLFLFLLFLVLGSYSVVSKLVVTWKSRQIQWFIGIMCLEVVAVFVEVGFLYKEFVDALVFSWQRSNPHFEPGITMTLILALAMWLGIRTLTWFLFAAAGTPTIMAVIQGTGLNAQMTHDIARENDTMKFSAGYVSKIKSEMNWIQQKGDEILASFIIPPLQILAATINFCSLFIRGDHLFNLPLKGIKEVMDANIGVKKKK